MSTNGKSTQNKMSHAAKATMPSESKNIAMHDVGSSSGPSRPTGAIPKQKVKSTRPNSNHLDEIVALPLDDL